MLPPEAEFGLRPQQMGTLRRKPFRSVIYGQPRGIPRTMLPYPFSAFPFPMVLQKIPRNPAFIISARNGRRYVNDTCPYVGRKEGLQFWQTVVVSPTGTDHHIHVRVLTQDILDQWQLTKILIFAAGIRMRHTIEIQE